LPIFALKINNPISSNSRINQANTWKNQCQENILFIISGRRNKQHGAVVLLPKTVKFSFPSKAPIIFKYSTAFSTCRMKLINYIINE